MNTDSLERLAELEHEQWQAWTRHLLDNSSPENLERWKCQMETPYAQLTDAEKEADRVWARKVIERLRGTGDPDLLYEGRFLRVKKRGRWEYVERTRLSGIVAVLAVTDEDKVILIEQFRPPVNRIVVEIPAGLAGDENDSESLAEAARRELLEETGYEAREMETFFEGPSTPGLTDESITFFRARGLRKVGEGHGDGLEQITRHEVPFDEVDEWLEARRGLGHLVDCRVYTALHFENRARRQ